MWWHPYSNKKKRALEIMHNSSREIAVKKKISYVTIFRIIQDKWMNLKRAYEIPLICHQVPDIDIPLLSRIC